MKYNYSGSSPTLQTDLWTDYDESTTLQGATLDIKGSKRISFGNNLVCTANNKGSLTRVESAL